MILNIRNEEKKSRALKKVLYNSLDYFPVVLYTIGDCRGSGYEDTKVLDYHTVFQ